TPPTTTKSITTTTTANLCGYLECNGVPSSCAGCVRPTTCSYTTIGCPANFDIYANGYGTGATLICDPSRGWVLDGSTVVANYAAVYCVPTPPT
ncbi:hypothetical protein PENTCL1PPCAC_29545, partial [Pristionchus entomophagus]